MAPDDSTELTPEEIVLRHAKELNSPVQASGKIEGGHGEGYGTGLPNDVDYTDTELKVAKFLATGHEPWKFDEGGHLWGPWMQENHSPAFPIHYRTCVHPECTEVQHKGPPEKPVPS